MRKFLAIWMGIMLLGLITPPLAQAQSNRLTVKGVVVDASGAPILGATVIEQGTTNGTTTDLNGAFQIVVKDAESVVTVSFMGYKDCQLVAASENLKRVVMQEDLMSLDEVVVIGYGAVKKNDMTGSVVAVKAEEINRGAVTSPQEMLRGKVPGVNVISPDGTPGGGGEIRVRGGASLSASNAPLIVIDGVPLANDAGPGMANGLSTVNPNDIASFTVLKDASATAIYGSRASNGVILITTKKGQGGKPRVSYSGSVSVKHNYNTLDMMTPEELKDYIATVAPESAEKAASLMGTAHTDWQKEVFRVGVTTDHNVSVYGSAAREKLPYRVSLGYAYDQGTLKNSDNQRTTLDISLTPSFLKDHLSVTFNAKGIYNKNNFVDGGVVGAAVAFDPSQSPYRYNEDGTINHSVENGYWNWDSKLAQINPFALMNDKFNRNHSYRALGNVQMNYKVHGLEDLSFNLNLGLDITSTKGNSGDRPYSVFAARDDKYKDLGRYREYENLHRNQLLEFYINYAHEWGIHNLNVMGGYSWSKNYFSTNEWQYGRVPSTEEEGALSSKLESFVAPKQCNALVSFYGRLNYSIASRYLFTATVRADGSSRFVGDNRWGIFPSAAFAWNIAEEKFLKDSRAVSALKLRLGWGVTGQQEIPGIYDALSYSIISEDPTTQYPLGPGSGNLFFPVKPQAYNANLKWEETTTYNVGLDFGFLNGRINGSVDAYLRKTDDLISSVAVPMGGNFSNVVLQNMGAMENKGIEFALNLIPVQTKDWNMQIGFNGTFQKTEITELPSASIDVGGSSMATGVKLQRHQVGYAPHTFYLWQQVYDQNGNPVENALVDRNGDGQITDSDRYMTNKSPNPDFYYGLNFKLSFRNWDFGFNGHGAVGNYMFNDVLGNDAMRFYPDLINKGYLVNTQRAATRYNFKQATSSAQHSSDLFLEDASYFRMDDINLGYTFRKLTRSGMSMRLAFGVQNVFVITDYSGLDPEFSVAGGIDSNIYPRPRIYSVRLGINF